MKQEIIQFYEDKNLQIPKMIGKRPLELVPSQIEEAAEVVYDEIKNGLEIKDISIARRVFRVAKQVQGKKYAEEHSLIEKSKKIIADLKSDKEALERDRDFWKAKHGSTLKRLDEAKEESHRLAIKNGRLKLWFATSYATLIWAWNIYKTWCAYEIIF